MTRPRIRQREQRRFFGRRPGIVPGRRFALVLALAAGLLGVAASSAAASADDPFVTARVFSPSGSSSASVSIGQLLGDPGNCPEYTGSLPVQQGRNTSPQTPGFSDGQVWAMSTILSCLRPAQTGVTSVTVIQNGSPELAPDSQLSAVDMGLQGGQNHFADPSEVPVVGNLSLPTDETVEYDRPSRGGSDNNFNDEVTESSGTPVSIEVFEGPQLQNVSANASPNTVKAGGSVSFSATFTPDSGKAEYYWKFDGGAADSTDAAPQVTFASPGTYDVTVQVIDSGSTGTDVVPVTVTSSSSSTPPPPGGGQGSTGPTHSGGTTQGGAPAANGGPKHASPHGHKGGNGSTGGTGKHRGSSKPTGTTTTPTTTTTSTTTSPTTPASGGTPAGGSGSGSAGSSGGPASPGVPSAVPPQREHNTSPLKSTTPAPEPPNEHLVTGQLVSDVRPLSADQSPLVSVVPAALAAAQAARPPSSTSILVPIAAGFAIVALLALGAARELRGRRDWRTLRFGS